MEEVMRGIEVQGMAAMDSSGVLTPYKFTLRSPGPKDVVIKILYCGICHSDLHQIRNDWQMAMYPLVPGHEIIGVVTEVGSEVDKYKVKENVGVGCMVDSCRKCEACVDDIEQYCDKVVWTYNTRLPNGTCTYGGFASSIVVDQSFVVRIPENIPLDAAAPLLCAGITVYSPMKYFGMIGEGKKFGVVGLGGLGHMAVKFAKAFGMKVTVISSSPNKEKEAIEVLGADEFIVSSDAEQMKSAARSLNYIMDTVSAVHPLDPLLSLLKLNGKLVLVGIPTEKPMSFMAPSLLQGRRMMAGSGIGSISETQEMMDFCGKTGVSANVECVGMGDVNDAMKRLHKSQVKYRFVIDVANTIAKL